MSLPDRSGRTEFRQSITRGVASRVDDVNFGVSVGTAIRRAVMARTQAPVMLDPVPAYRSVRYILMRDDIHMIDPDTCEIGNVIQVEPSQSRRQR
ncbi:hypothetical protein C0214_00755 [Methylobacterium sp. DM1]|nr:MULTISPECIES: hypothetical protein [unclassified Methylobacterium]AWI87021.1 hypothetical protein C0214_00755 [Methylobacterium sp. DM1]QIJ73288.1 hypothetical protein CLZ_00870 [Methylobacterium sp. CLZ]QIJ78192.1 hypothetical protein GU700_00870 [Methylobacterium sp. NI91]